MERGIQSVSAADIAGRRPAGSTPFPARKAWSPARHPRAAAITVGVAAAFASAIVAVHVGTPGTVVAARHHQPKQAVLTAAMVRRLAGVSGLALAHSGQAVIRSRHTVDGVLQQASTDTITFSRRNWDDALTETIAATGGAPATTQSAINRVVDGQAYDYFVAAEGLAWYHDTGPNAVASMHIPDPRKLLGELASGAGFVNAGHTVIDGVAAEHLRATNLTGLPAIQLPDQWRTGRLTALDVWVDSSGVVRRISMTSSQLNYPGTIDLSKVPKNVKVIWLSKHRQKSGLVRAWLKKADGKLQIEVKAGPAGVRPQTQLTTTTVDFRGIGQPQIIRVPAHAIPTYGVG
jgi:hypothetical protein